MKNNNPISPPESIPATSSDSSNQRSPSAAPSPSRTIKESFNNLVHRVRDVMTPPSSETSHRDSSRRGRSPDRKSSCTASTGRGGAGNMVTSKSRDRATLTQQEEQEATDRVMKKMAVLPRSHGRGGAGNIRSPSRDAKTRAEEQSRILQLEKEEKEIEAHYDDLHKLDPLHVGRGGAGNLIHSTPLPSKDMGLVPPSSPP